MLQHIARNPSPKDWKEFREASFFGSAWGIGFFFLVFAVYANLHQPVPLWAAILLGFVGALLIAGVTLYLFKFKLNQRAGRSIKLHTKLTTQKQAEVRRYAFTPQFYATFPPGPIFNAVYTSFQSLWPPQTLIPDLPSWDERWNEALHDQYHAQLQPLRGKTDLTPQKALAEKTFRSIYHLLKDEASKLSPPSQQAALGVIPFVDVANIKRLVQVLRVAFFAEELKALFPQLKMQLNVNRHKISSKQLTKADFEDNERLDPTDFSGTNRETITTYLKDTSLATVFDFNLPYRMKTETRFSGMYIVAPPRHGKTQTLEKMILADIKAGHGLVVIDPHKTMFDKLSRLTVLKDRLVIFDPADSPALSLFDAKLDTATDKEAAVRSVTEAASFFLSALLGVEMTGRQDVLYGYLAELMAHIPHATPLKLLDILSKDYDIEPHLKDLSPAAKRFFEKDFYDPKQYSTTRDELKWRLQKLVQDPAFSRVFGATENRFDVADVINNGKVLLIHTVGLKQEHATIVGQYFIGQTYRAAMSRLQTGVRTPAFLYVDEAAPFFKDETISLFLREVRKVSVGGVFVNQKIADITNEKVKAAFSTCAILLAAKTEGAEFMAKPMHTTPSFIGEMKPGEWALYDDDQYQRAVKVHIPFGALDNEPTLLDAAYAAMRARNKAAVQAPRLKEPDPPATVINIGPGKK